jgi:PRTRC genetic system protein C
MEGRVLSRHFEFNGVRLPDIAPQLSPEEIRTLYSHMYPDIATASITGPEAVGDKLVYRFTRAIGSKGGLDESKYQKEGGDEAGGPGGT